MKNIRTYITVSLLLLTSLSIVNAGVLTQGAREPYRPLIQRQGSEPPLNMIVLGRDHKLWYEAYNDASDLDGDGFYDVGYKGYLPNKDQLTGWLVANAKPGQFKIDYYGYFDSYKCYSYDSTNKRFNPASKTDNKRCTNAWSGDWLNYVTTVRMDAIRKVLYGGWRSTDTTSLTVLQRAYFPQDAHTWGKEYTSEAVDGYKISDYAPFTAPDTDRRHLFTVTTKNNSNGGLGADLGDITKSAPYNPPLLRVVASSKVGSTTKKGTDIRIWEWVSTERTVGDDQHITATSNTKVNFDPLPVNYEIRVKVCDSTVGLEDNCKKYGTSYKPTGLMQQYGDADNMRFGLLTGSYGKNLEGGLLRKNVGKITDEINIANGIINNTGIIGTLNSLRIEGFNSSAEYSCGWSYVDKPMDDGNSGCSMWGNPVGEMVYEAIRYFAGKTANPDYTNSNNGNSTVSNKLTLSKATWTDPYGVDAATGATRNSICSRPYITLISDTNPSWDDKLPGTPFTSIAIADEIFPSKSIDSVTKKYTVPVNYPFNVSTIAKNMWDEEFGSPPNKKIIIGEAGSNTDKAPTIKDASSFANIRGMPEEPGKRGTYYAAAAAYFARTTDINPAPEEQKIMTMAVAMASPLPKIVVPMSGTCPSGSDCKQITLTPYAKSVGGSGISASGTYQPTNQIVDFYIETIKNLPDSKEAYDMTAAGNYGRPYYKFRINYEDVEYGGDHDMDAIATYEVFKNADNTIKVKVTSDYAAGGIDQHMGYVISGTTADGIYLVVKDREGGNVSYWQDAQCLQPVVAGCSAVLNTYTNERTFTANSSSSTTVTDLKPPLYYVGKYGSFTDSDVAGNTGFNKPDKPGEWQDPEEANKPAGYFLVTNPAKLASQLSKLFARIDATSRSTAPVGGGSSSAATALRIYRSYFQMDQWSGGVAAMNLAKDSEAIADLWDTKSYLVPHASRKIFTHNGSNALLFDNTILTGSTASSMLNATQITEMARALPSSTTKEDRLQYLRGDNTKEGSAFRSRNSTSGVTNYIGDVLDAQPYAAGAPTRGNNADKKGYESYRTEKDGSDKNYYDYAISDPLTNRRSKVFFGANDGMLHIIDDSQERDTNNMDTGILKVGTEIVPNPVSAVARPGKELMAYVPSFVYTRPGGTAKLSEYTKLTGYNHEFFVNGQVAVADMIHGDWTTVLAGSVGFGGKGIYALNVTPDVFGSTSSPSVASDHVLFEYTAAMDVAKGKVVDPGDASKNLSDMGYITGRPILGKTNDGAWRVIVGNGYNSDSGEAVLKLININDLTDVVTLRTGEGSSKDTDGTLTPLNVNGLSAPVMVDGVIGADGAMGTANGTIDIVYAGDLKGNLWRFDLTSVAKAGWSVSKLFKATGKCDSEAATEACVQPITVRPAVGTFQDNGKTVKLVTFGTGKVIEDCDKTSAGCAGEAYVNTFYAIRDYDDATRNSAIPIANKKSKLQKQVIKTYLSGTKQQQIFRYIEGKYRLDDGTATTPTPNPACVKRYDVDGDTTSALVGLTCPSFKVSYNEDPEATITNDDPFHLASTTAELGWYEDLPEVANTTTDAISAKVVGDIQLAGSGITGIVKYSTFAPVNLQDVCDLRGISAVMVPNFNNGGQTLARLSTSGISKVINVGVVFDKAYPSGSTILNSGKTAGLGDIKGGGDCYNCDGKGGKVVLVTPDIGQAPGTNPENKKWDVLLRKGVVVPVNWREVSESDVD